MENHDHILTIEDWQYVHELIDLVSENLKLKDNSDMISGRKPIEIVTKLKLAGFTIEDHKEYFDALSKDLQYMEILAKNLIRLKEAGFSIEDDRMAFDSLCKNPSSSNETTEFLLKWKSSKNEESSQIDCKIENESKKDDSIYKQIPAYDDETVTTKFIGSPSQIQTKSADQLISELKLDEKLKIPSGHMIFRYLSANVGGIDIEQTIETINLLEANGINFENYPKYFASTNFLSYSKFINDNLMRLRDLGFNAASHQYVIHKILERIMPDIKSINSTLKIVNELEDYTSKNKLLTEGDSEYQTQQNQINKLIESYDRSSLTYGPLRKSEATEQIEMLLEKIVNAKTDEINLSYDSSTGYYIKFAGEKKINLTALLRSANLSQLVITEDLLEKINKYLSSLCTDTFEIPRESQVRSDLILSRLHHGEQVAISIYTLDHYYRNINKLFRGESITNGGKISSLVSNGESNSSNNMLANFLVGCLVNHAAVRLPSLLWDMEEKQLLEKILFRYDTSISGYINDEAAYKDLLTKACENSMIDDVQKQKLLEFHDKLSMAFPQHKQLTRYEDLDDTEKERRVKGVTTLPAITSFSSLPEGAVAFCELNTKTELLGDFTNHPSIYKDEGEVVFPHGEQVKVTKSPGGGFFAEIVSSPKYEKRNTYWSDSALAYAYNHYLKKEYVDGSDARVIANTKIARPNHGIAHTYRVMQMINLLMEYFSKHAKDDGFRKFCQTADTDVCEWLKVAGAFSVVGRESEISAAMDINRYQAYREASRKAMAKFVGAMPPKHPDESMQKRMEFIVEFMGNPNFEEKLNAEEQSEERNIRNYLHRILNSAHKLDLLRCYDAENYEKHALGFIRELSAGNMEQQVDLEAVIRYNYDLLKAQGDMVCTGINADGALSDVTQVYQKPFDKVSTSLRDLISISETVEKPIISNDDDYLQEQSEAPKPT